MTARPAPAFSLTVGPARQTAHGGETAYVRVQDNGAKPMHVTMTASELVRHGARCQVSPQHVGWVQFSPASFSLAPGQQRITAARLVPGASGAHTVNLDATAAVQGTAHQVALRGSVGSKLTAIYSGQASTRPCTALTAPHHNGSALPALIVLLVLAALLAFGIWRVIRKVRHA